MRTPANPVHQRSSLIELTRRGRTIIEAILDREHAVLAQLSGDFTEDHAGTTLRLLRLELERLDPIDTDEQPTPGS